MTMDLDLTMWVWVGIYRDSDGGPDTIRVFSSLEKCLEWRKEIAEDNWDDCDLKDEDDDGNETDAEFDEDRYWEYVGDGGSGRFERFGWFKKKVEDEV